MKKIAIVTLVCINVALLATLVSTTLSRADAQAAVTTVRVPPNYMLMTGHIRANEDAVYVLDVNARILAAWEFDHTAKRLERIRLMRDLSKDFNRR